MKNKIVIGVVVFAAQSFVACGDTSSSDSDSFYCSFKESATKVVLSEGIPSIGTFDATCTYEGNSVKNVIERYSSNVNTAKILCDDEKEKAEAYKDGSYQVSCTEHTVSVKSYSEYDDLSECAERLRSVCENDGFLNN